MARSIRGASGMISRGLGSFRGRRVLLLQSPVGPFFFRLAREVDVDDVLGLEHRGLRREEQLPEREAAHRQEVPADRGQDIEGADTPACAEGRGRRCGAHGLAPADGARGSVTMPTFWMPAAVAIASTRATSS